jgi:hypothetical protein
MRVAVLALVLALCACKRKPENVTPEGAVRELFAALEGLSTDPARSKDALLLLGPSTVKNLEARAQRASKVEGRTISSAEYLAAVRYLPRTRATKFTTSVGASGDVAEVSALDEAGHELTHLAVLKQGELWRVELPLPDMQPLQKRAP